MLKIRIDDMIPHGRES